MRRILLSTACVCFCAVAMLAQNPTDAGSPFRAAPNGFDAGDYVYISGQGPRNTAGNAPPDFSAQARQCLDNIRKVIETAGLTMDHVVYVQVYLDDVSHYPQLNEVFANYFPHDPPARAVLGVAQVPESPVQITAVAVRELRGKQPVSLPGFSQGKAYSPGMLTHDRLFVSSLPAGDFAEQIQFPRIRPRKSIWRWTG